MTITKKTRRKKRSFGDAFDSESRFYAGKDIKSPFDAVITEVKLEDLGDESKWCVYLDGHEKGVVLNKTNGKTLLEAFGDDPDAWEGQPICVSTERRRNPSTNSLCKGIAVGPLDEIETEEEETVTDDDLD